MARYELLRIWDDTDTGFFVGAFERPDKQFRQYLLPVKSIEQLRGGLDALIWQRHTFRCILISAHGYPGAIKIPQSGKSWNYSDHSLGEPGRFSQLFHGYGVVAFEGCNVAAGDDGKKFMIKVGEEFLRNFGGTVTGCTKYMVGNTGLLNVLFRLATSSQSSPTVRGGAFPLNPFGNSFRTAIFGPGGHLLESHVY
jgi:hypothetical protein